MNTILNGTYIMLINFLLMSGTSLGQLTATFTPIKEFQIYDGGTNPLMYKAVKIKAQQATATSYLVEKTIKHLPQNAIDNQNATSWVEGAKGNGIGEKLKIYVEKAPVGMSIMPGFAKNEAGWNKNNRVAAFNVRFLKEENGKMEYVESNHGSVIKVVLTKENGVIPLKKQYIDFGEIWTQNMESTEVTWVEIEITEADGKNAIYEDTCIAEVEFFDAIIPQ